MILDDRYWSKVQPAEALECWPWAACVNEHGYGLFNVAGRSRLAHRLSYTYLRDDIPTGLVLDHLCRVPRCVNPWHLEPVTLAVNSARGVRKTMQTHCKQGHPLTTGTRGRFCRPCANQASLDHYYRRKARALKVTA